MTDLLAHHIADATPSPRPDWIDRASRIAHATAWAVIAAGATLTVAAHIWIAVTL